MDPVPNAEPPVTPTPGEGGPRPPTAKRLTGLLLVGLGSALMIIGALMPWIRTSVRGAPDGLALSYLGIDLPDGKIVLGLGVILVAASLVCWLAGSPSVARAAALVIVVAAFAGVGVTAVTLISVDSRFQDSAVSDFLDQVDNPTDQLRSAVDSLLTLELSAGPFAVIGGGILAVAGGALTFSWANSRARDAEGI
jgi:hypothetical protein